LTNQTEVVQLTWQGVILKEQSDRRIPELLD